MAWVAVGSLAVSAAGTAYSASSAKSSAKATNAANKKIADEATAEDYQKWKESRESVLPTYAKDSESGIYSDLLSAYGRAKEGGSGITGDTSSQLAAALAGSNAALDSLMTGKTAAQRNALYSAVMDARNQGVADVNRTALEGVADVNAARMAGVTGTNMARSGAINTGLQESLAKLNAQRAASGLNGGSSFTNNLSQGATIGARQMAATQNASDLGAANLAGAQGLSSANNAAAQLLASAGETNTTGRMNVYDQNVSNILSNLQTPYTSIQNAQAAQAAQSASNYSDINSLLNSLGFFRIGTSQAPNSVVPSYQTVPNTGQAIGALATDLGSTALNYAMNNHGGNGGGSGYKATNSGYTAPDGTWVMPTMTVKS